MRNVLAIALVFMFGTCAARGQDDERMQWLALQKAVQKTIQHNETSIACIIVSRSEYYGKRLNAYPGQLGGYDPDLIELDPRMSALERAQILKKLNLADTNNVPSAFGSGVVVDAEGLILTNYHVVQDATKIFVRLPGGKSSYADIHAADARADLAVLKLIGQVGPLKTIPLGDADKAERGQFVLTLSNPFAAGFRDGQPSASWGILSNMRRRAPLNLKEEERIRPFHHYPTLLQTDTRMHLGSSGGALLNMQGELIGLLSSMAAIQGGETPGGYALPVNAAMRRIIDVLKRGEEIDYGFLGISFDERQPEGQKGILLKSVGKGSPADGNLKEHKDILLAINGQPIRDADDIYLHVATHLAGSKVRLLVRQAGKERLVEVTLAKLRVPNKSIASSLGKRPFFRGVRVDWSSLLAQELGRPTLKGVLVTEVQPNTAADRADLKTGDVILRVNQVEVPTPAAFYQTVAEARGPVELTIEANPPVKITLK